MNNDSDDQQRFALGFLALLITLVVAAVVGTVVVKRVSDKPAPAVTAAAPAAQGEADAPSIQVEGDVVKFYFATARADVAAGASEALAQVVAAAAQGRNVVISGFHDATGDAARNEELAKLRAQAVRAALVTLGVAEERLQLQKPQQTQADGTNAQARRVEVTLAP